MIANFFHTAATNTSPEKHSHRKIIKMHHKSTIKYNIPLTTGDISLYFNTLNQSVQSKRNCQNFGDFSCHAIYEESKNGALHLSRS